MYTIATYSNVPVTGYPITMETLIMSIKWSRDLQDCHKVSWGSHSLVPTLCKEKDLVTLGHSLGCANSAVMSPDSHTSTVSRRFYAKQGASLMIKLQN